MVGLDDNVFYGESDVTVHTGFRLGPRKRDYWASHHPALSARMSTWLSLHQAGEPPENARVLVHGASGVVGSLAVQLAKQADAYFPFVQPDPAILEDLGRQLASGKIATKVARVFPRGELLDAIDLNQAGSFNKHAPKIVTVHFDHGQEAFQLAGKIALSA